MIQTPSIPIADSIRIDVPVPGALERWRDLYLVTGAEKLLVFLAFAFLFYLLSRLARRAIGDHIEDINRRHVLRKWITYAYVFLLLLVAIALFADWLTGLGTILALLIAGIAVALQDVLKSLVGWLYMSSRAGIEIGSRIEVNGIVGDVIDIGVLKTTMLEVGGDLVFGRQSTGRLVTVPNYRMLSDSVLIAVGGSPYVWHEIRTTVTFESDWRRAEEILKEIGEEIHAEVAPELERGFRRLERRYAFKYGALTPIVYVSIGESGVQLTLRFMIHARRRRGAVDHASRRILAAFATEPAIRIAYITYRIYRPGEGSADGRPPQVADVGATGVGPEEGMVTEV
ncbi:MAG: mechanosensitive ion channel domain-containing protein [Gemmatimonadota bacterium]